MFKRRQKTNYVEYLDEIPIIGEFKQSIEGFEENDTTKGVTNLVLGITGLATLVGGGILARSLFLKAVPKATKIINAGFGGMQIKDSLRL